MQVASEYADLNFLSITAANPRFKPVLHEQDFDGWVGLKSKKQPETEDVPLNFLDQLVAQGLIDANKKMFSMYIADKDDLSWSSIQFGGFDESGFKDYNSAIKFKVNNN